MISQRRNNSVFDSDSEESDCFSSKYSGYLSPDSNKEPKNRKKPKIKKEPTQMQICPKCGLKFLYLSRHKKCKLGRIKHNDVTETNFGKNTHFFRELYSYLQINDISLQITKKVFEKVIQAEIQKAIEEELYSDELFEKYKNIKLAEVENFNESFEEFYQLRKDNNAETDDNDSINDKNGDDNEKRRKLFLKIQEMRRKRNRNGKMCKYCFTFFRSLQSHLFYDVSCKKFILKLNEEKTYFQKRGLIINQLKFCYKAKFKDLKLKQIFSFVDSCFDEYQYEKITDQKVILKHVLKLIGIKIINNDIPVSIK